MLNNSFSYFLFHKACTPLFGVFAVFMQLSVCAQQSDTSTNKTQQLTDVVVTGQYGENSLKQSLYKVRVIEPKRMQMQGAFNLKDVLSNELNIRISNDPVLGSSMNLQGVTGQNIKILIDGVPVIGREGGNIDLTQINMNNVERIELVEGPMSVNFGTDALGGVLNIITKKAKSNEVRAGVDVYYESIGQYNGSFNTAVANSKWSVQLNGGRNFFEGYSLDKDSRVKLWKPREQYMADITIGRQLKKGSIRLANSFFNEKVTNRGEGVITWESANAQDDYYFTRRLTSALFFEHKIKQNALINVVVSYSNYRRINTTVVKDLVTLNEAPSADMSNQDTTIFHLWMSRGTYANSNKKKQINYQLGYEINNELTRGVRIENKTQFITDYNAFGSAEVKATKHLLIRPGVRVVYNTKFSAPIIPSLNAKYDIGEHFIIRASYGRGFRAPSLKELYLSFPHSGVFVKGNLDLQAETGDNIQTSVQYEYKKKEKIFRFEPSAFYNRIHNMIDLVVLQNTNTEKIAQYMNIDKFQSVGINVNTEFRTPVYSLVLGYSYTGKNNSIMKAASTDKFFYSNEFRANATYKFAKADLTFALFYKYNGKLQNYQYNYTSNEITLGYINPYSTLDASLSKNLLRKKLSITAGVKNILNIVNVSANMSTGVHSAASDNATIGMGRTFFISTKYIFNWSKK